MILIKYFLDNKKIVLVPKVINNKMVAVKIEKIDTLKTWHFYILEHMSNISYEWKIDLEIVPGLSFSKDWKRLWKWWWFYDGFFFRYKK